LNKRFHPGHPGYHAHPGTDNDKAEIVNKQHYPQQEIFTQKTIELEH
jgi:hypothetical protein